MSENRKFFAKETGATIELGQTNAQLLMEYQASRELEIGDAGLMAHEQQISLQLNTGMSDDELALTWELVHEYD